MLKDRRSKTVEGGMVPKCRCLGLVCGCSGYERKELEVSRTSAKWLVDRRHVCDLSKLTCVQIWLRVEELDVDWKVLRCL